MLRIAHITNGQITNVSNANDDWTVPEDGSQMLESDAIAAGMKWVTPVAPDPVWPNAQAFMAAFTMQEMAAIALSQDFTIAALRFQLSTWFSTVNPAHELVQTGLNQLVTIGIITEARKDEIITTATA